MCVCVYVCVCVFHQPFHSLVEGDSMKMIKLLHPAVEIPISAGSRHVRDGKDR